METVRIHTIDYRLEAAAALCHLAYRGDNPREGDLRTAAAYYVQKYGVPFEAFAGIVEAYEYMKARLVYDETELTTLFGFHDTLESSLSDFFIMLERSLGAERVKNLSCRIAAAMTEDDNPPDYDRAELSDLIAYAQKLPAKNEERWLLVDACARYKDYRARMDALLNQAAPLLMAKADVLEPLAERALSPFAGDPAGDALYSHLTESGVRLDCRDADLYPLVMRFSSVTLYSNIIAAARFGEPERAFLGYGVLIDLIQNSAQSERDAAGTMLSFLHALDDKSRFLILTALKNRPLYGQEVAALSGLSPATVSHHMSELGSVGLITIEKQGVKLLYHLNARRMLELTEQLKETFTD